MFKYGSDESSGYKNWNFRKRKREVEIQSDIDDLAPPAAKKKKKDDCEKCEKSKAETISLFASQGAVVGLEAKISEEETIILYENPRVNSVFGHFPLGKKHALQIYDHFTKY